MAFPGGALVNPAALALGTASDPFLEIVTHALAHEWFGDTMAYVSDRYPELTDVQLTELRTLGDRFIQPAKRAPASVGDSATAA